MWSSFYPEAKALMPWAPTVGVRPRGQTATPLTAAQLHEALLQKQTVLKRPF